MPTRSATAKRKTEGAVVIDLPRTYTTAEVAKIFHLQPRAITRLIATKRIHSVKVGGRRVVPQSEVDRLTREGTAS